MAAVKGVVFRFIASAIDTPLASFYAGECVVGLSPVGLNTIYSFIVITSSTSKKRKHKRSMLI